MTSQGGEEPLLGSTLGGSSHDSQELGWGSGWVLAVSSCSSCGMGSKSMLSLNTYLCLGLRWRLLACISTFLLSLLPTRVCKLLEMIRVLAIAACSVLAHWPGIHAEHLSLIIRRLIGIVKFRNSQNTANLARDIFTLQNHVYFAQRTLEVLLQKRRVLCGHTGTRKCRENGELEAL